MIIITPLRPLATPLIEDSCPPGHGIIALIARAVGLENSSGIGIHHHRGMLALIGHMKKVMATVDRSSCIGGDAMAHIRPFLTNRSDGIEKSHPWRFG
jgi:hypothetical protein